jgi:hypothetical protein
MWFVILTPPVPWHASHRAPDRDAAAEGETVIAGQIRASEQQNADGEAAAMSRGSPETLIQLWPIRWRTRDTAEKSALTQQIRYSRE